MLCVMEETGKGGKEEERSTYDIDKAFIILTL